MRYIYVFLEVSLNNLLKRLTFIPEFELQYVNIGLGNCLAQRRR